MTSVYACVGVIFHEPKRYYVKNGDEVSIFFVSVKRNDNKNRWDLFKFEAYGNEAHYINEYLHNGDTVSIVSRPLQKYFKNRKGEKTNHVEFRVISINFVCGKEKTKRYNFGIMGLQELQDMDY